MARQARASNENNLVTNSVPHSRCCSSFSRHSRIGAFVSKYKCAPPNCRRRLKAIIKIQPCLSHRYHCVFGNKLKMQKGLGGLNGRWALGGLKGQGNYENMDNSSVFSLTLCLLLGLFGRTLLTVVVSMLVAGEVPDCNLFGTVSYI